MKLSAEFLILFVATVAVAGFVAMQVVPMVQQQAQSAEAIVTGVTLYSNKLIAFNVRNVGSKDVTSVKADVYPSGGTSLVGSYTWSGTIPPGGERGLSGTLSGTGTITAGQRYTVVVTVTFAGGDTKTYTTRIVALSA